MLLLPTLLQVIFDQAKRLVVIVNIMHSLHLRNKLCLIIKICIFKNHFLVKNMLQTPQLSPYLLVSPHPSRFSSLLNLGHHFLSETETKLYWVQSETKTIYSPFHNLENSIWKNSLRFVSALILLMWSLCLPSANWHLCEQHRAATDRTTTSSRPDSPECFSLSIFFGKSNQQAPLVWLSHSSLKFIYNLLIDLINYWLIIVIYHLDLLIDFHIISIYWLIYIVIDYCDDYFDWFAWHFLG